MTDEEFEKVVRETIKQLPKEFLTKLDNLAIVIEDDPPMHMPLLGLYQGVPKTTRLGHFALPDKITIYKNPMLRISTSIEDAKKHIAQTVLHEVGHHFGLSDQALSQLKKTL